MSLPFLLQVPDGVKKPASFVPKDTLHPKKPFAIVEWKVKSSDSSQEKYIVVNDDGSLSVKVFDPKECRRTAAFVKIEVHECKEEKTTKETESRD